MNGRQCLHQFMATKGRYTNKVVEVLQVLEKSGWLTDERKQGLIEACRSTLYDPNVKYKDIGVFFSGLGYKTYRERDVVALVKYLTGEYGTIAFRNVFSRNSEIFKLRKLVYGLLEEVDLLDSQDIQDLELEESLVKVALTSVTDNHYISGGYHIVINVDNLNRMKSFMALKGRELLEFYYPNKNVLIYSEG